MNLKDHTLKTYIFILFCLGIFNLSSCQDRPQSNDSLSSRKHLRGQFVIHLKNNFYGNGNFIKACKYKIEERGEKDAEVRLLDMVTKNYFSVKEFFYLLGEKPNFDEAFIKKIEIHTLEIMESVENTNKALNKALGSTNNNDNGFASLTNQFLTSLKNSSSTEDRTDYLILLFANIVEMNGQLTHKLGSVVGATSVSFH